ncbi:hypothetical protein ScPMuIL_017686 [Solemya velum]
MFRRTHELDGDDLDEQQRLARIVLYRNVQTQIMKLRDSQFSLPRVTTTIASLNKLAKFGKSYEIYERPFTKICKPFLKSSGYGSREELCQGMFEIYGPYVWGILANHEIIPKSACQTLGFCKNTKKINVPSLLGNKPKEQPSSRSTTKRRKRTLQTEFRILHVTDIHIDDEYAQGSPTECGLIICCRTEYSGSGSAGQYGHFNCNTPQATLDVLIDAMRNLSQPPDFIVFTGDTAPHNIWSDSLESHKHHTEYVVDQLKTMISGVPVYPAFGNHEGFPSSMYHAELPETKIYNANISNWWSELFTMDEGNDETIKSAVYYATDTPVSGLKVLSLNTMFGYAWNYYVLLNDQTPQYKEQWDFAESILADARINNEKVVIIGHHSPGIETDIVPGYSTRYSELVHKYSDVILLQLFGHTHDDHFVLTSSPDVEVKTGVSFIAPSVTPFGGTNPSFRVYYLDEITHELLDYDQYRMNLDAANDGSPMVELVYSAMDEYDLPDMSAQSWHDFTNRLLEDDDLFNRYWNNKLTGTMQEECDQKCRLKEICKLRSSSWDVVDQCLKLL